MVTVTIKKIVDGLPSPATTAAAAATTAATAATPVVSRTSFVDIQRPFVQLRAVQTVDCRRSRVVIGHLYKSKSSGSPGISVLDNVYVRNLSEFLEGVTQLIFCRFKRQVADVDVHSTLPKCLSPPESPSLPDAFNEINRFLRTIARRSSDSAFLKIVFKEQNLNKSDN